jgi:hypothetical protein
MEQQWRKAVSLQRKRAVMACFRMVPVYNISRLVLCTKNGLDAVVILFHHWRVAVFSTLSVLPQNGLLLDHFELTAELCACSPNRFFLQNQIWMQCTKLSNALDNSRRTFADVKSAREMQILTTQQKKFQSVGTTNV